MNEQFIIKTRAQMKPGETYIDACNTDQRSACLGTWVDFDVACARLNAGEAPKCSAALVWDVSIKYTHYIVDTHDAWHKPVDAKGRAQLRDFALLTAVEKALAIGAIHAHLSAALTKCWNWEATDSPFRNDSDLAKIARRLEALRGDIARYSDRVYAAVSGVDADDFAYTSGNDILRLLDGLRGPPGEDPIDMYTRLKAMNAVPVTAPQQMVTPDPARAVEPALCPHDAGTCHHRCQLECWRKRNCAPLSPPYPDGFPKKSDAPVFTPLPSLPCGARHPNGKRVKVRVDGPRDYTVEAQAFRKRVGHGEIVDHHDSHGLCYRVKHDDGTIGAYDPDELYPPTTLKPPTMEIVEAPDPPPFEPPARAEVCGASDSVPFEHTTLGDRCNNLRPCAKHGTK